jgi:hypothetical protein
MPKLRVSISAAEVHDALSSATMRQMVEQGQRESRNGGETLRLSESETAEPHIVALTGS